MDIHRDWLALYLTPGLGMRSWQKLLSCYTSPSDVLEAGPDNIRKMRTGVSDKVVGCIDKKKLRKLADDELARADKAKVRVILQTDDIYPERLRTIHDPPALLYVKGNDALLSTACIGMVGARAASVYGQRIAEDLAKRLTSRGLTVVSGLALGIDAAAHSGALRGSGATIGVLGCGLDVVYPRQNRKIYEEMADRGAIVSEYPFGSQPEAFRFPARNRIISGLSLGVVVVEAARRSGSLITAGLALDQGREVFAIPGRIDSSKSEGTHRLLQQGAKLVHTVEDIIEELVFPAFGEISPIVGDEHVGPPVSLTENENKLYTFLDVYPQTIDEITLRSCLPVQKVNELLLMLELKGVVVSLPGGQYQIKT